jgi:1-acyl-sn-glycerol-3-phosphate acyltransferase
MASKKNALPMPKFHATELNVQLRSVAIWLAPVVRLLFGLRVKGIEKLPKTGPYVLVSNHLTNVDPLAVAYFVYVTLKRAPHFMAKESLFRLPLVGKLLLAAGQIPVYRSSGNRNDEPLRVAHEYLKRGHTIAIFPEGTLTPSSGRCVVALERCAWRSTPMFRFTQSLTGALRRFCRVTVQSSARVFGKRLMSWLAIRST